MVTLAPERSVRGEAFDVAVTAPLISPKEPSSGRVTASPSVGLNSLLTAGSRRSPTAPGQDASAMKLVSVAGMRTDTVPSAEVVPVAMTWSNSPVESTVTVAPPSGADAVPSERVVVMSMWPASDSAALAIAGSPTKTRPAATDSTPAVRSGESRFRRRRATV